MQHLPALSLVFNFALLFIGLVYFTRKPVNDMLKENQNTWKHDIEEAENLRKKTQDLFDGYQSKLSQMDSEMDAILADAKTKGEAYKVIMMERAEKSAQAIIAEAKSLAEQELVKAKGQLKNQALQESIAKAKISLKEKIKQDDQDFFVDSFIRDMEISTRG